jgi:hypothetical protein
MSGDFKISGAMPSTVSGQNAQGGIDLRQVLFGRRAGYVPMTKRLVWFHPVGPID